MKRKITTYDIIVVALMAAMVFATTYFIRIEIPTPTGPSMLKAGNILCLLAGLLFGGMRGGLAAGIGSMFYDLLNPMYVASAPFTLVFFFTMAFICGVVSHIGHGQGRRRLQNTLAAVLGAVSYLVLHIGKNVVVLVLAGSTLEAAFISNIPKMLTSMTNGVIAVVVALFLEPLLRRALDKAGVFQRLGLHKAA